MITKAKNKSMQPGAVCDMPPLADDFADLNTRDNISQFISLQHQGQPIGRISEVLHISLDRLQAWLRDPKSQEAVNRVSAGLSLGD